MAWLHHCVDGGRIQFLLHPVEDCGTGLGILKGIVVLEWKVNPLCKGIQRAVRQLGIQMFRKLPGAVVAQLRKLYAIFEKSSLKHTKVKACVVGHHYIIADKGKDIGPDIGKGRRVLDILGMDSMNRDIERIKSHLGRGYKGIELVQYLIPIKAHHPQRTGAGLRAVGCLEI